MRPQFGHGVPASEPGAGQGAIAGSVCGTGITLGHVNTVGPCALPHAGQLHPLGADTDAVDFSITG